MTPSEFLQISGRAGRRGMDTVGHVVTVQTPGEGAVEAAFLATATPEPLRSCFTPSYGMVLNLLQKHSLDEVKDLLEKSFAEYIAQLKLDPQQAEIAQFTIQLAKLDVKLAGIKEKDFASYEKLNGRLKAEQRLLKTLQQQALDTRRSAIAPLIPQLPLGSLVYLRGKNVKVSHPVTAVLLAKIPGSGKAPLLLCLGVDNRWYIVTAGDVVAVSEQSLPQSAIADLSLPEVESGWRGRGKKGDEAAALMLPGKIAAIASPLPEAPEVMEHQARVDQVKAMLAAHPLADCSDPAQLLKLHRQRNSIREQLHRSQLKYQKLKSSQSYYWQEFLSLIEILQEFNALDGYLPTPLGEAAAVIRAENQLWLAIVCLSGDLDNLEPAHLATAISALVTDNQRPDSWTNYIVPPPVLEAFRHSQSDQVSLREQRRRLIQIQSRHGITIPAWLEVELSGIVEQWAYGREWQELWENASLDEGDIVRLLRRAIDVLSQIPQIPHVSQALKENAREAMSLLRRFPI